MFDLTVKEVADILGVNVSRVHQLISIGKLKAQKVGNLWLVDNATVQARLKSKPAHGRPSKKNNPDVVAYDLYNRTHKVMQFNYDLETAKFFDTKEIFDADRIPVALQSLRSGRVAGQDIQNWFSARSVPYTRKGVKDILIDLDICYAYQIPFKSFGLSLSDQYWVCPTDINLDWHKINYFDNEFEFDTKFYNKHLGANSPDNTSNGELLKRWVIIDGVRYLQKCSAHFGQEAANEVVATKLYERLLDTDDFVKYDFVKSTTNQSQCMCFVDSKHEFIPAFDVYNLAKKPNDVSQFNHYINMCVKLGCNAADVKLCLSKQIFCDEIIANSDRHWYNFGLVRNVDDLSIKPAPIFDSGNSLWYDFDIDDMKSENYRITTKPFFADHRRQLRLADDLSWVDVKKLDGFADEAFEILKSAKIEPERIDTIIVGLKKQLEQVRYYL